jgi:hypothetical protein
MRHTTCLAEPRSMLLVPVVVAVVLGRPRALAVGSHPDDQN